MMLLLRIIKCYLKKTPKVDKSKILQNVVISFTCTPVRIYKIWPTINSMLLQSQLPSKIYLWIPKHFKRFSNTGIDKIPTFLKNNPLIQIEFIEKDWGPATKLLPCLEKFKHQPDTKIIVIDDDRIYPKNFVKDLVRYSQQYPCQGISIAGVIMENGQRNEYTHTDIVQKTDVILGYQGYLVKPQFFSAVIFDYPDDCPEAFFEDDVWISGHLKRNNVSCLMVPSQQSTQSWLMGNVLSHGLCMNENKDKTNFMKTWVYLEKDYV